MGLISPSGHLELIYQWTLHRAQPIYVLPCQRKCNRFHSPPSSSYLRKKNVEPTSAGYVSPTNTDNGIARDRAYAIWQLCPSASVQIVHSPFGQIRQARTPSKEYKDCAYWTRCAMATLLRCVIQTCQHWTWPHCLPSLTGSMSCVPSTPLTYWRYVVHTYLTPNPSQLNHNMYS